MAQFALVVVGTGGREGMRGTAAGGEGGRERERERWHAQNVSFAHLVSNEALLQAPAGGECTAETPKVTVPQRGIRKGGSDQNDN